MNCLSPDELKYPRLDDILNGLEQKRSDLSDIDYSSYFNSEQVSIFRDLILDAHGGEYRKRKEGGLYIEEHIAEVMEKGEQIGVPPSVIVAYGLHDFIEDHKNMTMYGVDKSSLRDSNRGKLEQQIKDMSLESIDRNIILNVAGLMTKPTDEELKGVLEEEEDRRFVGKVFGSLGGNYWDRKLSTGYKVNDTQRFYSQLGILLDMYSNGNSLEEPSNDTNTERFIDNQKRNTQRMIQMGRLLDTSIRSYPPSNHIIFNKDEYDRFREKKYIPRMIEGIDKFNIDVRDEHRRYWNL